MRLMIGAENGHIGSLGDGTMHSTARDLILAHQYICAPANWSVGAWFLAGLGCLVVLALVSDWATDKARAAAAERHAARKAVRHGRQ